MGIRVQKEWWPPPRDYADLQCRIAPETCEDDDVATRERAYYEGAAGKPLTVPGAELHHEVGQRDMADAMRRWGRLRVHGGNDPL